MQAILLRREEVAQRAKQLYESTIREKLVIKLQSSY
jgi:hypothetical protein